MRTNVAKKIMSSRKMYQLAKPGKCCVVAQSVSTREQNGIIREGIW
jgi:hypothetical protein